MSKQSEFRKRMLNEAKRELHEEGLMRIKRNGEEAWTHEGIIEAYKTFLKWNICMQGNLKERKK